MDGADTAAHPGAGAAEACPVPGTVNGCDVIAASEDIRLHRSELRAKERHHAGDGDCQQQEQCDGALANRERGEIEAAHGHSPPLTAARATASLPVSRTC